MRSRLWNWRKEWRFHNAYLSIGRLYYADAWGLDFAWDIDPEVVEDSWVSPYRHYLTVVLVTRYELEDNVRSWNPLTWFFVWRQNVEALGWSPGSFYAVLWTGTVHHLAWHPALRISHG